MIPEVVLKLTPSYPSAAQSQRIKDIVKSMQNYDVVCMQETYGGFYSDIREKLITYATKAGFLYHTCDEDPQYSTSYFGDGGVMILSRLPIVATLSQPFSYSQN